MEREQIIREELSYIFDKVNKLDIEDIEVSSKLILVDEYTDNVKACTYVSIKFEHKSDTNVMDETISNTISFFNYNKDFPSIKNTSILFMQGSTKLDVKINRYECRIVLNESSIYSDEEVEEFIKFHFEKRINTLKNNKLFSFIEKYNITSFDDYLEILTISTRDVNKYAKEVEDKSTMKRLYQIKDWSIKSLLNNDYIAEIKKHTIKDFDYALFITKATNSESLDGVVSFHLPVTRLAKFDTVNYLDAYEEETREYKRRDTGLINRERMLDFIKVANSSIANPRFDILLKEYFDTL